MTKQLQLFRGVRATMGKVMGMKMRLMTATLPATALLCLGFQAPAFAAGNIENEFAAQRAQIEAASSGGAQVTLPVEDSGDLAAPSANDMAAPSAPVMPTTEVAPALPEAAAPMQMPVDSSAASQAPGPMNSVSAPMPEAAAQAPVVAPETQDAAATEDPLAAFRAAQQSAIAGGIGTNPNNPLGPAAQLPVSGNLPATAYATGIPQTQEDIALAEAQQKEKAKQQLFEASLNSLMPLSPEQTRSLLDSFRQSREAAEEPITIPEAKTTVQNVSLDPSDAPPIIKTSPGYVTTVTILDMTGSPWAIQDISWAGKFQVTTPEEGGHVIRITPMSAHGVGNLSIRLVDLITPVTFSIHTGLDEVDYRFDARIPKQGPLAKTPLIEYGGLKSVAGSDENLMRVLDGTSVADARKLKLDGVDGSTTAWRISDVIYLRTPLSLLSPAWDSSATSADGMNVYTLRDVPVILLSDRGRMVKAKVVPDEY